MGDSYQKIRQAGCWDVPSELMGDSYQKIHQPGCRDVPLARNNWFTDDYTDFVGDEKQP